MTGHKVFVSFDHSEDLKYKNLLRAWNANTDFDFEFEVRSPNVEIESEDASVIKAALTRKMRESEYFLVIIGKESHTSEWMNWEITRAMQLDTNLKIAAVKINSKYINPVSLPANASLSDEFTLEGIINALANATNKYKN